MVAGQQVADVCEVSRKPYEEHLRLLARIRERSAGHRRNQRRALSGVRQKWKVALFRGQHGPGTFDWLARSFKLSASRVEKHLRSGIEERRSFSRRTTKRRGKSGHRGQSQRSRQGRRQGERGREKRRREKRRSEGHA